MAIASVECMLQMAGRWRGLRMLCTYIMCVQLSLNAWQGNRGKEVLKRMEFESPDWKRISQVYMLQNLERRATKAIVRLRLQYYA